MKVGTRSILFGVHQFMIHPLFVAAAWWRLYGFPWDPRLWVAFVVHDLGYVGKPNMDGPEGERHVELGARIVHWLFDRGITGYEYHEWAHGGKGVPWRYASEEFNQLRLAGWRIVWIFNTFTLLERPTPRTTWRDFCLYHSRYAAARDGKPYSRLCVADKLAIALTPAWLYMPMAWLSGELREYMERAKIRAAGNEKLNHAERSQVTSGSCWTWYGGVQDYMRRWVEEHKDLRQDTWTASRRQDYR